MFSMSDRRLSLSLFGILSASFHCGSEHSVHYSSGSRSDEVTRGTPVMSHIVTTLRHLRSLVFVSPPKNYFGVKTPVAPEKNDTNK